MKVQVSSQADALKSDLVAWLVPQRSIEWPEPWRAVIQGLERRKAWKAEFRRTLSLNSPDGRRLGLLVGLGPEAEVDGEKVRRTAAIAAKRAASLGVGSLALLPLTDAVGKADAAAAAAEGAVLASYRTPAQRRERKEDRFRGMQVRLAQARKSAAFQAGVERGVALAQCQNLARELGDLPANRLTPSILGERAVRVARGLGLRARVWRKRDLERMGMGGILAVNRGSHEPPVLIEVAHRPKRFRRTVCIVGKGITFDTGGISLKPAAKMEDMKYDMCGGAAALGAVAAAARLELPVHVVAIVPATDNMPGGAAQKPGDVLQTASGLTVEVINTDAEGRLVLADGLHHARRFDPDFVVDLATLTGACVVALGRDAAGLFGNDEGLVRALKEAGDATGERVWPMPLFPEYDQDIESKVADWKNVGGREAGSGTAAWFLSKFVGDRKWAHLDIAGVAYKVRERDYVGKESATGFGVRLLARWLESLK